MKKPRYFFRAFTLTLTLMLIFPFQALAYLDPGTGSYILQAAIGALLGGLFILKTFWRNIKTFITGIIKTKKD